MNNANERLFTHFKSDIRMTPDTYNRSMNRKLIKNRSNLVNTLIFRTIRPSDKWESRNVQPFIKELVNNRELEHETPR